MHFLREKERYFTDSVSRPIAAVTVKFERVDRERLLVVCTPDDMENAIGILKMGVVLAPVPAEVKVIDPESRKPIKASKRFWVTIETFDPYHMVIDAERP